MSAILSCNIMATCDVNYEIRSSRNYLMEGILIVQTRKAKITCAIPTSNEHINRQIKIHIIFSRVIAEMSFRTVHLVNLCTHGDETLALVNFDSRLKSSMKTKIFRHKIHFRLLINMQKWFRANVLNSACASFDGTCDFFLSISHSPDKSLL